MICDQRLQAGGNISRQDPIVGRQDMRLAHHAKQDLTQLGLGRSTDLRQAIIPFCLGGEQDVETVERQIELERKISLPQHLDGKFAHKAVSATGGKP